MAVMIKAHAEREAHLKAAQVAHLEACAYRGVAYDPGEGEGCPMPQPSKVLTYRGVGYKPAQLFV